MSKSNEFAAAVLNLIFKNTDIATIGDAGGVRGSVSAGNLYLSLHTSDPGEAVTNPTTTETTYTNYVRQAVVRGAGWTVSGTDPASVSPAADVDFPECGVTAGAAITHFAVTGGIDGAGDELVLYSGTVTPNITMATGVIPRIKATSAITED